MKKIKLLLIFVLGIVIFSGCNLFGSDDDLFDEKIKVKIEFQDYGTMELELYSKVAPKTVSNFVSLVKDKFYDGTTIHRVMENFMIQGGDPTGTGRGGLDRTIKGEFKANGIENKLKHERGVISMARDDYDYDSASCQFFIMQKDDPTIDGYYAAFGKVTKGIEIIDKIVKNTKVEDNDGTVAKENQPVITKVYIVE